MLAKTLREHFAEKFPHGLKNIEHEEISWTIQDWFSSHGMEIVADDRKFLEEIGEDVDDYMEFDEEQESRIGEVYDLVHELCELMISPLPGRPLEEQKLKTEDWIQLTEDIARLLDKAGYVVYFPTHCYNADGTEFISDMWQR